MSLSTTNASQERIGHLAGAIALLVQNQFPALLTGAIITAELIDQVREVIKHNLKFLGNALISAGLLTLLPTLVVTTVNLIGFTSAGVLQGSLAAVIQAAIYGGQTGGLFSLLQGFGATAVISPPLVIGIGAGLTVVGAGILGYKLWKWDCERRRVNDKDEGEDGSSDPKGSPNGGSQRKDSNSQQVVRRSNITLP